MQQCVGTGHLAGCRVVARFGQQRSLPVRRIRGPLGEVDRLSPVLTADAMSQDSGATWVYHGHTVPFV